MSLELERISHDAYVKRERERIFDAFCDPVAMLLLAHIATLDEATEPLSNLQHDAEEISPRTTVSPVWLSFGRLWRADLVAVDNEQVEVTPRGKVVHDVFTAS